MNARDGSDAVVLVEGDYGSFEGLERDEVVLGRYLRTGTYAPELVALIAERLFQGGPGTLIDVGANLGLVTIPVLERSRARAIAFEPEPINSSLLLRNLERHGLRARCTCHALALDAKAGDARLLLSRDNSGDHRLAHGEVDPRQPWVAVSAARLDDVLEAESLERPVVLKLDCQGAEARVLEGAKRTLERVDYALVEYWPAGLLRLGDHARVLEQALCALPYASLLWPGRDPAALQSTRSLFEQLAFVPKDGSDEGFFDLLLSRAPLTARARETHAPR